MKRIMILVVALSVGIAGAAAAAIQYQARASDASDVVARKLDVVASLLMEADGRMRNDSEVAIAARELLAMQTVLAGQEFPTMSEEAQSRVMTMVKHVESQEALSQVSDEGVRRWAAMTRECMLASKSPRSCGIDLPSEIKSQ